MKLKIPVVVLLGIIFSTSSGAQLPTRLERCLPYPEFSQEIKAANEGVEGKNERARAGSKGTSLPKVITAIKYDPDTRLSPQLRWQLKKAIVEYKTDDASEEDWVNQLEEVTVKGFLQERGYFQAHPKVQITSISSKATQRTYSLLVSAQEGEIFYLGNVSFEGVSGKLRVLPEDELRGMIQLKRGDPFNTAAIAEGIKRMQKSYENRSYIDAVIEPVTSAVEGAETLDLVLKITPEIPYRIGAVEFVGLTPETQQRLTSKLIPGEPFDRNLLHEIIGQNRSLLPKDASESDISITRHSATGTVDVKFDFFSCPKQTK